MLKTPVFQQKLQRYIKGIIGGVSSEIKEIKIPLPPIEVQERIVEEIENYQNIIDGAKKVVESYKPTFKIDKDWEMVELDAVSDKVTDGSHFSPKTVSEGYPYITVRDVVDNEINFKDCEYVTEQDYLELKKNDCQPLKDDLLFSKDGTVGKVAYVDFEKEFVILSSLAIIRPNKNKILPKFLKYILQSDLFFNQAIENKTGVAIRRIVLKTLKIIKIPLPPLEIQKEIVARIDEEQKLVYANKKLIELFEKKIADKIAEVWGE